MTAIATAAQVLAWAAEPAGPVPVGPLWDVSRLASPPDKVGDAACQLARRTAARLGAGKPPFGARGPIGLGTVFLAAAAGGRQQAGPATLLAQAVPPASVRKNAGAWYDLVARHGLVSAVITALDEAGPSLAATARDDSEENPQEPLAELLLGASPLTAVLYRPTLRALRSDTTGPTVTMALNLLSRPRGQPVLAAGLAGWSPFPDVLRWRESLLARLRLDHEDLLLDVYLAARTRFRADWDERIYWAGRQLSQRGSVPDPLAIATLRFWAPLAAVDRSTPLSRLRPLLSGHDQALTLVRRFRLDQAGVA